MALNDPESIDIINRWVRPISDSIMQLINSMDVFLDKYNENSGELNTLITANPTLAVHDGAYGTDGTDGDGRPLIDEWDNIRLLKLRVDGLKSAIAGLNNGNFEYIPEQISVNPAPRFPKDRV